MKVTRRQSVESGGRQECLPHFGSDRQECLPHVTLARVDVLTIPQIDPQTSPVLTRYPLLLVVLLASFLFFFQLGRQDLYRSHEARAAQNALRMVQTGEWGLPVLFDGQVDLQKPPGFYWLVAALAWLNGNEVTPWIARLPAAAAGLATVFMIGWFLRREGGSTAAIVASCGLATAVHFTGVARTARIDIPLTAAVTASLLCFYRGCAPESQHRTLWHFLSAVAAAVAVMLKGPVGLALIGPTALAFLVVERLIGPVAERSILPWKSIALGLLVVAGLAAPWFVWAELVTNGEFSQVFFWHHNVARFTGSSPLLASYPWWYYAPRFAIDFLPWSPVLFLLIVWAYRSGQLKEDRLLRFGLVWGGVMFAILSASHFKRSDYLLPLFPAAAIALGCTAESWLSSRTKHRTIRNTRLGFGLLILVVIVGWQVMIYAIEPVEAAKHEKRKFAAVVREQATPGAELLLFRAESHLLAFHLGRPLHTLVEWPELREKLAPPGPHVVVMPAEYATTASQIVTSRKLRVICRLEDFTRVRPNQSLVLVCTDD